jgi:hypothetical protein
LFGEKGDGGQCHHDRKLAALSFSSLSRWPCGPAHLRTSAWHPPARDHAALPAHTHPCTPLFLTLGGHPIFGQGYKEHASSLDLAIDMLLHHFVQPPHSKTERIHLLQEISAAPSAQPAVTTSVDARGVFVVLDIYGHASLPRPARHCFRTLTVYLVATLVHSPPRLANRTPAHVYPSPRVSTHTARSRAKGILLRTPPCTPCLVSPLS